REPLSRSQRGVGGTTSRQPRLPGQAAGGECEARASALASTSWRLRAVASVPARAGHESRWRRDDPGGEADGEGLDRVAGLMESTRKANMRISAPPVTSLPVRASPSSMALSVEPVASLDERPAGDRKRVVVVPPRARR